MMRRLDGHVSVDTVEQFRQQLDARFRAPLISYFLRRVHDRPEAEDLTQEVFVRLVARAEAPRAETVASYVFAAASNLLRDRARRNRTRRTHAHESLDDVDNSALEFDLLEEIEPSRVLLGRELLHLVVAALNELDERSRHILVLFRVEKMRQKEIADLYGISVKAVERHVAKASAHLASRIPRGGDGTP
jgi:RNA polymerase sigma-70 factor (ECF subfamily)